MKAVIYNSYGSPGVLDIKEIDKPVPKDDEVLIKIYATTVNRTDCGFRQPEYLFVRLFSGIFKPKRKILGSELAGEIEAIGKNVKTFKVGDQVFGLSTFLFGTHAQYVCLPEKKSITTKPANMTFNEAAAICDGAFLAYNYISKIDFKKNPKILINGASGSIGSAGVQLAKHFGADITATCNPKDLDLIKSLGANKVLDYTKVDFTKTDEKYDVVFDAVGKSSFSRCKHLLKPNGIYYSSELGPNMQNVWMALLAPFYKGKKALFPIPVDKKEDIEFFKKLIEAGEYKAVIDSTYPLEQIVEATRFVEKGVKTGNVVITVAHD